jgi:2-dehydro-3-deoxygluconokinase
MKTLCFGEIMLRLTPPDGLRLVQTHAFEVTFGGSEANVAVSLTQLGLDAAFLTRVPDSELGRAALGSIARYGVETQACIFGGDRLGLYFLEKGAGLRGSKILYDRAHSGMYSLTPKMIDWQKSLKNVSWLHWSGITPAISQSAADATLEALAIAKKLNIKISCDLNYREKLWQYSKKPNEIMENLLELTDVVLGDVNAFDLYFGLRGTDETSLLNNVSARFPQLQQIAMTSREGLSASNNTYKGILWDKNQVFLSKTYELSDMVDRIGGGDAFMAGLIFGLQNTQYSSQDTIEFAVAASALKHYTQGDYNLSTEKEVLALLNGNSGGKVSR